MTKKKRAAVKDREIKVMKGCGTGDVEYEPGDVVKESALIKLFGAEVVAHYLQKVPPVLRYK